MCSLRDAAGEFAELGVQVLGVSTDDVASVAKFQEAQKLGFPLLSDPDGSAATKYDVYNAKRVYANRVTFVIDEKGVLRAIDDAVSVGSHGTDLIERIRKLRE